MYLFSADELFALNDVCNLSLLLLANEKCLPADNKGSSAEAASSCFLLKQTRPNEDFPPKKLILFSDFKENLLLDHLQNGSS